MAGLLDNIKNQLTTSPTPPPELGQTEQAAGLLRAKLGKELSQGSTPAQSTLREQVAQQATAAGLEQIGQQSQIAAEQFTQQQADQKQQTDIAKVESQERLKEMSNKFNLQASQILDELKAGRQTLDANKQMGKMEQASFLIRGANENYISELKRQGDLNRLANDADYKQAMARAVMDEQNELFDSDMKFKQFMDSNDRDFQAALSNMSDDFALRIGALSTEAANAKAIASSVSDGVSTGLRAWEKLG